MQISNKNLSLFKKSAGLFVFLIFLLGVVIRMGLFLKEVRFPADAARDLLVGIHMVKYGELPLVGHYASGISFYYPPYYFYFQGLLNYLFRDPIIILQLFLIWQAASIFLVYLIGKKLFNKRVGLIASTLLAVSQYFVRQQTYLFSGPTITPLFLAAILIFFDAYKRKKEILYYFSFILLITAGVISYSSLIFVPLLLLFYFYVLFKKRKVQHGIVLVVFVVCLILIYIKPLFVFGQEQVFKSFNFVNLVNVKSANFIIQTFFYYYLNWLKILIADREPLILMVNFLVVVMLTLSQRNERRIIFILLFVCAYPILLSSIKTGEFHYYYLDNTAPLFIIIISWAINGLMGKHNIGLIIGALIFVATFIETSGFFQYVPYVHDEYGQSEDIARRILSDTQRIRAQNVGLNDDFYQVYIFQHNKGSYNVYNSVILWYHLERLTQKKIVYLEKIWGDFKQINSDKITYLYCLSYKSEDRGSVCIKDFLKNYQGEYKYYIKNGDDPIFVFIKKGVSLNI